MTDPTAPDPGATQGGQPDAAQAKPEDRVRHALEELGISVIATGMVVGIVNQVPETLFPPQATVAQVVDFWRAASRLLLQQFEALGTSANETIAAVTAMMAHK